MKYLDLNDGGQPLAYYSFKVEEALSCFFSKMFRVRVIVLGEFDSDVVGFPGRGAEKA